MKTPVYLDNNATTPVDPRVLEAMLPVLTEHFGNPASKTHAFGWMAAELVEIAREQVAAAINAEPEEIIFTSGTTESNNLALQGLFQSCSPEVERKIISVKTEHDSVLEPLQFLKRQNIESDLLTVDSDGLVSIQKLEAALNSGAALVSIMLANNEIGVIQNIKFLAAASKKKKALFHTDAAQALGKIPLDVHHLGIDLLSLSGHKIYGPKGIGALYIRKGIRHLYQPLLHGGGHEGGMRGGTLNVPGIIGMGRACQLAVAERETDSERIKGLAQMLLEGIKEKYPNVRINGSVSERIPGNLNLAFPGIDAAKLAAKLNARLAFSLSSACSSQQAKPSHVLSALGLEPALQRSSIRIGVGRFNTEAEIKFAVDNLIHAVSDPLCRQAGA